MNKKTIHTKAKDNTKGQSKLEIAAKSITEKPLIVSQKPVSSKIASSKPAAVPKPVLKSISTNKTLPPIIEAPISKPKPKLVSKPVVVNNKVAKKELLKVTLEDETYFVYLKNPLEYRRQLLECSRKVLFCLKIHQEVFLIRQKKLEEMQKLKISVRELMYLNKKFNDKLPKYNTGALTGIPTKDHIVTPAHVTIKNMKKPVESKVEKTEMERLEESLANIERKLKTLQ